MTDSLSSNELVTWLRSFCYSSKDGDLHMAAADEIERLRAALKRIADGKFPCEEIDVGGRCGSQDTATEALAGGASEASAEPNVENVCLPAPEGTTLFVLAEDHERELAREKAATVNVWLQVEKAITERNAGYAERDRLRAGMERLLDTDHLEIEGYAIVRELLAGLPQETSVNPSCEKHGSFHAVCPACLVAGLPADKPNANAYKPE